MRKGLKALMLNRGSQEHRPTSSLFTAQSLWLLPLPVTFPHHLCKLQYEQKKMPTNIAYPTIKHSYLRLCKPCLEAADPS